MIDINTKKIKRVEKSLGKYKSKTPLVLSKALNRAVSNVKTNIGKLPREGYHIKARDIKKTLKTFKSRRNNLAAGVLSRGSLTPLDKFKVSPGKPRHGNLPKVLKVAVKKDGLKALPGAFVTDINGPKVFRRVGKKRLPIGRLKGPSVPQIVDNKEMRKEIAREANKTYEKRLKHEISRVLEGN